jgi:esterase/lipase
MKFILLFFLGYISVVLYFFLTQDSKVFNKKYATPYTPTKTKIIYFKTSDNILLEGGVVGSGERVLYFGGNANNVIEFLDKTASNIDNFEFIAFNYPGYSNSKGKPSEENILKYALEIFDYYKPKYIIGRSLGSAVGAYVASKREIKNLLLITPFDSIENIAKNRYPFLPLSLILKHKFNEIEYLKKVKAPINAIFVKNDTIIPKKSIENLLNTIKFNKVIFLDASHGRIYEYPQIENIIKNLLKD